MKVVLQRVTEAQVVVKDELKGRIGIGYLILVGFTGEDDQDVVKWMADKITRLRVFNDEQGKKNRSLDDVGGSVLVVSQFTLYGDARKGRRPSFLNALSGAEARVLYDHFIKCLCDLLTVERVATGEFGAMMDVSIENQGPFTLVLER